MMEKYPHLLSILEDGYGQEMVQTLADSIQHYILAMAARGERFHGFDLMSTLTNHNHEELLENIDVFKFVAEKKRLKTKILR